MAILIDTNILLRLVQPHHPQSPIVQRALGALRSGNEMLYLTSQNLVEFWAVATRATSENGLGMTVESAARELGYLRHLFLLLADSSSILDEWQRVVTTYTVRGKSAHDARIVAAMNVYGITTVVTFNIQDFTRYTNISAIHPAAI